MDIVNETVNLADKISDSIKDSQIYKDYRTALSKIEKDAELMERIRQLKIKHIDFANDRINGIEDFNKEKYISQEFFKVMLNENARIYFMNEEKLVNLIADVYTKVIEKCDLNLFA